MSCSAPCVDLPSPTPSLPCAQCGTLRLKLLKIGAQIRISVRRGVVVFSEAFPGAALFRQALARIQALPPDARGPVPPQADRRVPSLLNTGAPGDANGRLCLADLHQALRLALLRQKHLALTRALSVRAHPAPPPGST